MKTITKLIWGMFSAAICVMYKWNAFGGCSYVYLTSRTQVGTTACTTKLLEQINYAGAGGITTLEWFGNAINNTYGDDGYKGYQYLTTIDNTPLYEALPIDTTVATKTEICDSGYYVYQCSNGGTPHTDPTVVTFNDSCTGSFVICSMCPPHPKGYEVTTGADFNQYTFTNNYSNDFIPVCGVGMKLAADGKTLTTEATGYTYAFWIQRKCTASTEYANFHMISNCYAETTDAVTDTTGTYNCTDTTGTVEYPRYTK